MNKSELVEKIANDADMSKASAERVLSSAIEQIIKAVTKGNDVQLIGFGTFKSGKRSARVGRNPQTGAEIKIPAAKTVKFTAGAAAATVSIVRSTTRLTVWVTKGGA